MSTLIYNFAKGWSNKARHELMKDEFVYVGTDVDFSETGAVKCRKKHSEHSPYFAGFTGNVPINNIYKIDVEGTDKQLIYWSDSGGLRRWNSATNTTTIISIALTSARHISYAPLKPELSSYTYVYITDGVTQIADNGTTTKTWGIDPPGGSPTVAISAESGDLSAGEYSYVYTFYDGTTGSESDPSPACAVISASDGDAIDLTNIETSGDSRVTSRRLYRTIADGGTRYLVATIPDNVVREHTDYTPDEDLSIPVITDQGVPPSGDIVIASKNTMFMAGDTNYRNRLYFCIGDNPDNWPTLYFITAGYSGVKIQNACDLEGKIYLITQIGVVGLEGTTPDSYITHNTKAGIGTYCRWSPAVVNGGIYYLARDGVYKFDGVKATKISVAIDRIFEDSPTSLYSVINRDQAPDVCIGACFSNRYYLIVPLKDITGTTANKLLEYYPSEDQWRLIDTSLNDIFGDDARNVLYGSARTEFSSGAPTSTVYSLLDSDSGSTYDTPDPVITTKCFDITASPQHPIAEIEVTYGIKARRATDVAFVKEYRIDADGTWSFTFYLDNESRYAITLQNLSVDESYKWRNFPTSMKGRFLYVTATATNAGPTTHKIREIEVR